jgi:exopolysaccharide production protein ExoQ
MRDIATLLSVAVIIGLFILDRDREHRTSKALWIPVIYFLIACSRPVSAWLGIAPAESETQLYLNGSPVDRAVDLVLLIAAILVLLKRRQRVGALLRRNAPILLFFSYALLSVFWSDFPLVTFKHWTKGVGDVAVALIVVTDSDPAYAIRRLLSRTAFVLIPLSLLFSKYYPELGRFISPGWITEYSGVTQNKNELGQICMIFGLASLWCVISALREKQEDRLRHLLAHGALLAIVIWLFVLINSMTSMSAFALATVLLVRISRLIDKPIGAKVHLAAAGVLALALFALFFDSSGDLVRALGRNPTLTGRTEIWHWIPTLQGSPLFGTGYESFFIGPRLKEFWKLDNGSFYGLQEAHNGYLEVYLNLGWIGVGLFAGLLTTGYHKLTSALRKNSNVAVLGLAYFVATLLYSLTEAGFRMQTPVWILLLWGIGAASEPLSSQSTAEEIDHPDMPLREEELLDFRKGELQSWAVEVSSDSSARSPALACNIGKTDSPLPFRQIRLDT